LPIIYKMTSLEKENHNMRRKIVYYVVVY
jgi:hypothetical protein